MNTGDISILFIVILAGKDNSLFDLTLSCQSDTHMIVLLDLKPGERWD